MIKISQSLCFAITDVVNNEFTRLSIFKPCINKVPKLKTGTPTNPIKAFQFFSFIEIAKTINAYNKKSYLQVITMPAKIELMQRFLEFLSSQYFNKKYSENKKELTHKQPPTNMENEN